MAKEKPKSVGVWPTVKPFVNGGASGILATCVIQPIDLIKVTLKVQKQHMDQRLTMKKIWMTRVDELSAQIENDKVEQRARDEAFEKKLVALQQLIANQHRREDGTSSSHG